MAMVSSLACDARPVQVAHCEKLPSEVPGGAPTGEACALPGQQQLGPQGPRHLDVAGAERWLTAQLHHWRQ